MRWPGSEAIMRALLERLCAGESMSRGDAEQAFDAVMGGDCPPATLAALLVAMKTKGETPDEIAGAATAMRRHAIPFPRPDYAFADCCGTGGDGAGTLNVSTAVAFILAECGLPVAKHGNRAVSSSSGSADVLQELGLRLDPEPVVARRMLDETGFCFLFAPQYHPGVKHAMPVRRELGMRTLFNLLGPLSHPAAPPVQLLGVYDSGLCVPLAETLGRLGCTTALVVNGGVDEVALHGPTHAALLRDGAVSVERIEPAQAGLAPRPLSDLAGGTIKYNAAALLALLDGDAETAYAQAVALNAGAALWALGRHPTLADGTAHALDAIRSGQARRRLDDAVRIGHDG
jgi:anthranilate phosphoribosyltransferase